MNRRLRPSAHDSDAGAVLVLALVMLGVGMIIIGMLTYGVTNDLNNSTKFASTRSLEYAESSAVSQAVQSIRYTPLIAVGQTLNASPPSYCWGSGPSSIEASVNGESIAVWCSTIWTPTSANTRVVTISACLSTKSATSCAHHPSLQATFTFDDYPPGVNAPSTGICEVYCGNQMTVDSWNWSPTIPTVSGLSVATGPITGGTAFTITGTNFVTGSTVNFVEETGGVPTSDNVILQATSVSVTNSTSINAVAPVVTDGVNYFVTVTTPIGTSAASTSEVFSYVPTTPTVTSVSPVKGDSAGGSSIVVNGSGYMTGSQVTFTEESGGKAVTPAVTFTASIATVASDTEILAVTPAVTVATSYFVTVATPGGTSATTTNAVFTFSPLIPTVASITPTTGSHLGSVTITITGTGFVTGATVQLVQETNGTASTTKYSATAVTVDSATTITARTPAITAGDSYFVTVTTTTGTSDYYPVFTAT